VGKSSLMRAIQDSLRKTEDNVGARTVRSVWFNAWKYKDATPVLAGMLGALLNEIGDSGGWSGEFRQWFLTKRGRIAKAIIYAFPAMLDKLATGGAVTKRLDASIGPVEQLLAKCDDIDLFQQAFLEVAAAWLQDTPFRDTTAGKIDDAEHCLAVFIDDLDRCDEEQIRRVLEAVKLFLDFPGVCFYLAMDQQQLDGYLRKAFGEKRSAAALDKFVQVLFDIPEPPASDFRAYVVELLGTHPVGEHLGDEERQVFAANLPANPRAVKRCLNDLAVWFSVFEKVNQQVPAEQRQALLAYASRYHLLAHAVQRLDRARWNAKAGSAEVLLTWLRSLPGSTENVDDGIRTSDRIVEIARWMLDETHKPQENLERIVSFRQVLVEPASKEASGGPINPLTWVRIPGRAVEICAYPVTQSLYWKVMGVNPSRFQGEANGNHPVETVSWIDAVEFCNRLSKKEGMAEVYSIDREKGQVDWDRTKKGIRLPTEDEWQVACMADKPGKETYGPLDEIAWHGGNSDGATHLVGEKKPNAWGSYDMLGNVWEWCWDKFDEEKPYRVLRGGSWSVYPQHVRASNRLWNEPDVRYIIVGFRLSRDCSD
jgi:formylglycine-generating enzyme required for sulfatase activity